MKTPLRIACAFGSFAVLLPVALACSCIQRTPSELYADSTTVFVGTVQDTIHSPSISRVDVRLSIHESWKGTIGDEIWLHTAGDSAACGVNFERGKTYTVLAILNEDGTYSTTLCSGTEEYQQSSPLMKYLRTLQTSSSSSSSSRTSSSSDMCEPYVCPSGKTYPACTPDGHPIYYFAYPCQFDSGNIFTDVPQNHRYYDAIKFVKERGIVSGYSDGSFHPDSAINRAEFTKIIVESIFTDEMYRVCDTSILPFRDVRKGVWYSVPLCVAVVNRIISGYDDGTFRPENNVNFAEAAKIVAGTFGLPRLLVYYPEWWQGPIHTLTSLHILPPTYARPEQLVTRGEMAFMIQVAMLRSETPSSWSSRSSSSRSAQARDGCKIGGCSAQLCVESTDDGISTCEWTAAYACYQSATCERQPNGQCAWTQTRNLTQCLNNAR